jgi:hypothetical protein
VLQSQTPMSLGAFLTRTPHPRDQRTSGFVELTTLLPLFPRLLVVGAAGSGKTTFLQLLAKEHPATPLFVRLAALAESLESGPAEQELPRYFARCGRASPAFDSGCILLLDAIDEVTGPKRRRLLDAIAASASAWPRCPIIVTSRPIALADIRAFGFRQAAIEPFPHAAAPRPRRAGRAARRLAFAMTMDGERRLLIDRESATTAVIPLLGSRARRWIRDELREGGILVELDGLISFSSTSLQESLAAEELASRGPALLPLLEPHFGDPCRADLLALVPLDLRKRDASACRTLFHDTLALVRANADPIRGARALAFADRVLRACEGDVRVERIELHEAVARHLNDFGSHAPAERIALTDALLHESTTQPAGDLLPVRNRPSVLVGRCPVTVAEYRPFVDDGGSTPAEWERQLRTPRHPVVSVSWHDASAYCDWLAGRSSRRIVLPDSAAWEAAATHDEGPYPWGGGDPDEERLNCDQRIGRTTPVGVYPRGAAPGGHLDLGGNVWEWCRDGAGDGRVVRGGGWFSRPQYAESAYHYRFHPDNRFHDLGFRIAEKEAAS